MRFRAAFLLVVVCSAGFAACSLNPQPLPPDTNDGGFKGGDAALGAPDANGGGMDSAPVPEADAASEAEADASIDADLDASDASDATDDATHVDAGDAGLDE